jgi:hypothetical protein
MFFKKDTDTNTTLQQILGYIDHMEVNYVDLKNEIQQIKKELAVIKKPIDTTRIIDHITIPIEPTTPPEILPTEDRTSLLAKYKEIIARLQTQPKGSPEREQTITEYNEIKQKLARLKK